MALVVSLDVCRLIVPPVISADFDDSLLATTVPSSDTEKVPEPLFIFKPVKVSAVIKLATRFPSMVHALVYGQVLADTPYEK